MDIGDQNGQDRHQHLLIVTNTFRPWHQSPTSMSLRHRVSNRILDPNPDFLFRFGIESEKQN